MIQIGPVGVQNGRVQVVEVDGPGHPAKGTPGVLQSANEVLRVLPEEGLAVRPVRETSTTRSTQGRRREPFAGSITHAPVPKST